MGLYLMEVLERREAFRGTGVSGYCKKTTALMKESELKLMILKQNDLVKKYDSLLIDIFIRLTFTILIFFSINSTIIAQDKIGFACGYDGNRTESVVLIDSLVTHKNYNKLRDLLTSNDNGIKCLAVIVCEILEAKEKIKLTEKEKTIIKNAYNSKNKIKFCSGCTYNAKPKLTEVLNEINFDDFGFNIKKITKDRYDKMIE
jgi:hypothetical protein